ncbi:hypothetical protein [Tropicibacter sp. S64]|uniref:hypothetical protein n=1 Tax=Tropicibacter sp. S64 TaxID=3415122 RepID=UPI003C7AE80B
MNRIIASLSMLALVGTAQASEPNRPSAVQLNAIQSYAPQADLSGIQMRKAHEILAVIHSGRSNGLTRGIVRNLLRKAGIDPRG